MAITKVQSPEGKIIKVEHPDGATQEEIIAFAQSQGGTKPMLDIGYNPEPKNWKQNLSAGYNEALPIYGGFAGSLLGGGAGATTGPLAPAAAPTGFVAGGAAGTAIGEQLADVLDEWLGVTPTRGVKDSAINAVENINQGAQQEALGLGLGAGLSAFTSRVPKAVRTVGNAFTRNTKTPPVDLTDAGRIAEEVPGIKFTHGMATRNPETLSLERSAALSGDFPGMKADLDSLISGNQRAISDRLRNVSSGRTEDFTDFVRKRTAGIDAQRGAMDIDPQVAGRTVRGQIDEAKAPVKAVMSELEAKIPDYQMDTRTVEQTIGNLLDNPKTPAAARADLQRALKEFTTYTQKHGKTTHSMLGFKRTLDELYEQSGTDTGRTAILKVRDAVMEDFNVLSRKARTGEIKVHGGKTYNPDDLARELEDVSIQQARLTAESKPNIPAAEEALRNVGYKAAGRVPGETDAAYLARLQKDYTRKIGPDFPMTQSGSKEYIDKLVERSANIRDLLGKLEPGQDVAAILNAYNDYSHKQFFNRFDTQTIRQVLDKNRNLENVIGLFKTPTAVQDLNRAIGKEKATEIVKQTFQADFTRVVANNPPDARLQQWLKKNANTMKQSGVYDYFSDVVKNQTDYNLFRKLLKTDNPAGMFDEILKGNRDTQKLAIRGVLRQLKGDPKAVNGFKKSFFEYLDSQLLTQRAGGQEGFTAFHNKLKGLEPTIDALLNPTERRSIQIIRDAISTTQLISNTPLGGSRTAELLKTAETSQVISGRKRNKVIENLTNFVFSTTAGAVAGKATGSTAVAVGVASASGTGVRAVQDALARHGDEAVRNVFIRATFDPEYAYSIMKLVNGNEKEFMNLTGYLAGKTGFMATSQPGQ